VRWLPLTSEDVEKLLEKMNEEMRLMVCILLALSYIVLAREEKSLYSDFEKISLKKEEK
jgi:hypothetical protein